MTVPEETTSPRQRAASRQRKEEVSRHQQALDQAQEHYLRQLKASSPAIGYLKKRGLNGQTASTFGRGWSGTDRRGLAQVFPKYEDPILVESGLVVEAKDRPRYYRFCERWMFPNRN